MKTKSFVSPALWIAEPKAQAFYTPREESNLLAIKENSLQIEISCESTRSLHAANFSYGNTTKLVALEAGLR